MLILNLVLLKLVYELAAGVLHTAIGMMDQPFHDRAIGQCHRERSEREMALHGSIQRPSDPAT